MHVKKIAVIGLGSIGTRHLMNVLELGLEAIGFDPDENKSNAILIKAAETYPYSKFSIKNTLHDAISGCDAVIVANPHKYHFETLLECINLNKHCLVEKPLAVELNGLEDALRAAKEKGLLVSVGFNMRFRPVVTKAKEAISKLGKIHWARFICASYLPDWRKGQDYRENYTADPISGGVIFDVSHELDLAHYLLGKGHVVSSYFENSGVLEIASEDIASILIKHDCGAISNIHLDYITRPKRRYFECAGDKGLLHVDLQEHKIKLQNINGEVICDEVSAPEFNNFEYLEELKHFVNAIEGKMPLLCKGSDGMNNLKLILQAKKLI